MFIVQAVWTVGVAVVMTMVDARPEGVPDGVCETMEPGHGGKPQTTKCPFRLYLNKYEIFENGRVMFTIEPTTSRKFRGFMVQARDIDSEPIGEFIAVALDVKTISCSGRVRNTASHTNSEPKEKVQMVWKPPEDYIGTCTFYATVVADKDTYWVRQPAERVLSIKYSAA